MWYSAHGRMDEDLLTVAMRRLQKEPTSLFKASAMGDRKGVIWLLEMGEDVNSKNEVHKIYIYSTYVYLACFYFSSELGIQKF